MTPSVNAFFDFFCIFFAWVYYRGMANQRAAGLKMITVWLDAAIVAAIEKARVQPKFRMNRSEFIRFALEYYLEQVYGIEVPNDAFYAPSRQIKKDNPVVYSQNKQNCQGVVIEESSSSPQQKLKDAEALAVENAKRVPGGLPPLSSIGGPIGNISPPKPGSRKRSKRRQPPEDQTPTGPQAGKG
jgi:hypothetical protein